MNFCACPKLEHKFNSYYPDGLNTSFKIHFKSRCSKVPAFHLCSLGCWGSFGCEASGPFIHVFHPSTGIDTRSSRSSRRIASKRVFSISWGSHRNCCSPNQQFAYDIALKLIHGTGLPWGAADPPPHRVHNTTTVGCSGHSCNVTGLHPSVASMLSSDSYGSGHSLRLLSHWQPKGVSGCSKTMQAF